MSRSSGLEAALEALDGIPDLAENDPGDEVAALGFLPSINQSYRTAFAALSEGLRVKRLVETLDLEDGTTLPAGTFLISAEENSPQDLRQLWGAAEVPPVALAQPIEANQTSVELPRVALVEN